jgi:hypothetical protein
MDAIADKLDPQAFLALLKSLTVSFGPVQAVPLYEALLAVPCAGQLSPEISYQALHTLAILGCRIGPALEETSWVHELTAQQAMTLMQMAAQQGNYTDIGTLCEFSPGLQDLSPQCVLQLALQLLQEWRDSAWGVMPKHLDTALTHVLTIPGTEALSVQECNQLAAIAIQKGEHGVRLIPRARADSLHSRNMLHPFEVLPSVGRG